MTIAAFSPKFMKVGILTAALQELNPRDVRDADPDRAIEDWLAFGHELGADYIQLSAALHPTEIRPRLRRSAMPKMSPAEPLPCVLKFASGRIIHPSWTRDCNRRAVGEAGDR